MRERRRKAPFLFMPPLLFAAIALSEAPAVSSAEHDTLDRLTAADNADDNALDQSFTYALNGNMLSLRQAQGRLNSALGSTTYPASPTDPRPHAQLTAGARSYAGACPRA